MKITADNKYELIDRYVKGEMNEQEVAQFSSLIASDDELSAEMNLVKELNEIQSFEIQEHDLKSTLQSIRNPNTSIKTYLKYALGLLVFAAVLMFLFKSLYLDEKISYNEPLAMVEPLELSTKADTDFENLQMMQEFYNQGDYKSALPFLEDYLNEKPKDLDVLLAKGVTLMNLNKFSEAQSVFTKIKKLNPRVKKFKWFMAMNLLKQGQEQKAQVILRDVVDNQNYNWEEAEKLLDK